MYAVLTTGGKQYKVTHGDVLRVEKLEAPVGESIEIGAVNLVAKDDGIVARKEDLENAKVVCDVLRQGRGKKIRVFKFKRRKGYKRTVGHRQDYTELRVREILV